MGRLRVLSGRELCQILQQHGFAEVRRRGSHVVMQRRTDTGSITVPVQGASTEMRQERGPLAGADDDVVAGEGADIAVDDVRADEWLKDTLRPADRELDDPWQITDDGQFCRTWNVWDRGRPRCYRLYREGETFALHAVDRWGVVKLRRMNP